MFDFPISIQELVQERDIVDSTSKVEREALSP
jgi:hypothetical protein